MNRSWKKSLTKFISAFGLKINKFNIKQLWWIVAEKYATKIVTDRQTDTQGQCTQAPDVINFCHDENEYNVPCVLLGIWYLFSSWQKIITSGARGKTVSPSPSKRSPRYAKSCVPMFTFFSAEYSKYFSTTSQYEKYQLSTYLNQWNRVYLTCLSLFKINT